MAPTVSARFVVHTGGETWTPIAEVEVDWLVEHWSGDRLPTCCTLLGGFQIIVDGEIWNEDAVDEIAMAGTWLTALEHLARGGRSATVWAWEESYMTLGRRGERLIAFDVHHGNSVVCPLVEPPFEPLLAAMLRAATAANARFAAIMAHARADCSSELAEALARYLEPGWGEQIATIEPLLEQGAWRDSPPPCGDEPLPDVHVAIAFRDRAALERALEDESPDASFRQTPAIHAAIQRRWTEGVALLCERGANLMARSGQGQTPLQAATSPWGSHEDMARLMLDAGASLDLLSAVGLGWRDQVLALSDQSSRHPEILSPLVAVICKEVRDGKPEVESLVFWLPAILKLVEAGAPLAGTERPNPWGWYGPALKQAEQWELPLTAAALRRLGA